MDALALAPDLRNKVAVITGGGILCGIFAEIAAKVALKLPCST